MKLRKSFSLLFAACSSSLIAKDICRPCNNLQERADNMKMIEVERKVTQKPYYMSYDEEEITLKTDETYILYNDAVQASIFVYSDDKGNSGTCS